MTTSTTTAGTTMRAIIQENYGEAENVLRLGQTGRPAIGDREVLLRVHAAGGVGTFAVQIAKAYGADVTSRSPASTWARCSAPRTGRTCSRSPS